MSYSAWSASLSIPHITQAQNVAATTGTVPPASAALSISYGCSCGRSHSHLGYLFWCKQCQALQCQQCTMQQVDTYFCPACLNSVFTTPAFANQNRSDTCEQCVECPSCFHILSPMHRPSGQYAYVCEYCKWCSEDFTPHVDSANATAATTTIKSPLVAPESNLLSVRIKEAEQNPGANATFTNLLSFYKVRTAKVNPNSAMASLTQAKRGAQLFDEFETLIAASDASNPLVAMHEPLMSRVASLSISSPSGHGKSGSMDLGIGSSNVGRWMAWREKREELLHKQHYAIPDEPRVNHFDPIRNEFLGYFGDEKDGAEKGATGRGFEDLSTLPQRLAHPSGQHLWSNELVPRRKALSTKLAHRCRTCNKFLVKPGPGASKPTMEIHQAAVNHMPTVTIGQFRPLRVAKSTSIILYFKNPIEKIMKLWLTLPTDEAEKASQVISATTPIPLHPRSNTTLTPAITTHPPPTATIEFIRAPVTIAAYDEISEDNTNWQDDSAAQQMEAEPMLVVFRHLSKVGLLFHITPTTHQESTHFTLLVHLQFEPDVIPSTKATATAPTPSPPAVAEVITFPVHINLGFAQP